MDGRARVIRPLRAAMNVKIGFMWPLDNGTVVMRNKKSTRKIASGTRSFGSTSCESKIEMMVVVRVNTRKAVASNSVKAAFHIWKLKIRRETSISIPLEKLST